MVMVASGDFIELLFFSSVAGFYASEHGCQRTWQCYLLQNNGAILFLSMRIDKVYVGTYALPFAYSRKKLKCGRFDRQYILRMSCFEKNVSREGTVGKVAAPYK